MELEEKTIRSSYPFLGKVVKVRIDDVLLPNGRQGKREIVEHSGAVAIVPITGSREVLFIRQYRKAAGKVLLEIPAGLLEKGETIAGCAQRELAEETGYGSRSLFKLASFYPSPGFSSELIHIYLAQDLVERELQKPEDEFIRVEKLPLQQARELIQSGAVEDGKTIVGLLLALEYFETARDYSSSR